MAFDHEGGGYPQFRINNDSPDFVWTNQNGSLLDLPTNENTMENGLDLLFRV